MAYEHKVNSGTIFKNKYKQASNHPDYKGEINVNGNVYEIALWIKEGQKGKFFSAAISEPYNKEGQGNQSQSQPETQSADDDSGIPF